MTPEPDVAQHRHLTASPPGGGELEAQAPGHACMGPSALPRPHRDHPRERSYGLPFGHVQEGGSVEGA